MCVGNISQGRREGGGKLSPPPFEETNRQKSKCFRPVSSHYEKKQVFFFTPAGIRNSAMKTLHMSKFEKTD